MPFPLIAAIMAAAGLAKGATLDKDEENRQAKTKAEKERVAYLTGDFGTPVQKADPFGSAMNYGLAGLGIQQGMDKNARDTKLNDALVGYYNHKSGAPQERPMDSAVEDWKMIKQDRAGRSPATASTSPSSGNAWGNMAAQQERATNPNSLYAEGHGYYPYYKYHSMHPYGDTSDPRYGSSDMPFSDEEIVKRLMG